MVILNLSLWLLLHGVYDALGLFNNTPHKDPTLGPESVLPFNFVDVLSLYNPFL